MSCRMIFALAFMAGIAAGAPQARADCYDVYGCTDKNYFRLDDLLNGPNCNFLWTIRNVIYKERGYCFRTRRAIENFGNAGCQYDDVNSVPLNQFERANVATIAQAERIKSCPR